MKNLFKYNISKALLLMAALGFLFFPSLNSFAAGAVTISKYKAAGVKVRLSDTLIMNELDLCYKYPDIKCTEFLTTPIDATVTCQGGSGNGGWVLSDIKNALGTKKCGSSLKLCYDGNEDACFYLTDQFMDDEFPTVASPSLNVRISSLEDNNKFTRCDDDDSATHKQYCVWSPDDATGDASSSISGANDLMSYRRSGNDEGGQTTGLTGNTGDDMFRLSAGAEGFLEYVDLDENNSNRIKYIKRYNDGDPDMMIPAGPKNALTDYKNFMDNPPSAITVKNACFPMKAEIFCDFSDVDLPAVDGICGVANGTNVNEAIPESQYCKVGRKVNLVEGDVITTWECTGYEGGDRTQCSATHIIDGQCGSASGQTNVTSMAGFSSAEYCAVGDIVSKIENDTAYTWKCQGKNGGVTSSCQAAKPGPSKCIYNVEAPGDMRWSKESGDNRFYIGTVGDNYWVSQGQCGLFDRTIYFTVEDVDKVESFYFDEQGWDDIMGIYINDKLIWNSHAFPTTNQCELSTSWIRHDRIDARPYLKSGSNKIRLVTYVQGAGESWVKGYLKDNCGQ